MQNLRGEHEGHEGKSEGHKLRDEGPTRALARVLLTMANLSVDNIAIPALWS